MYKLQDSPNIDAMAILIQYIGQAHVPRFLVGAYIFDFMIFVVKPFGNLADS